MSGEIATTQNFQERMFERIKDQMGDLLSEEDLKVILERSIEKAFFEPQTYERGYRTEVEQSPFVKMIERELHSRVHTIADKWMSENKDRIEELIRDCLGKGFTKLITDYLDNKMGWHVHQLQESLINQLG